jgi:hypothetical protein
MSKPPVVRKKDMFTRARAERALSKGADPTEERFTKHVNKHVRAKAEKMAARAPRGEAL